jgi:SulP family sulfate permease
MIVAMLVGSAVAAGLNRWLGKPHTGIDTVGAIAVSLPPLTVPDLSYGAMQALLFPAFVVSILALTEAVAIARAIAVRSGQHIDSNQEFIGQGLANVVGSFFSAYPSSGSFNRSGANFVAGARTPLAAVFSAALLLLIASLAAGWAAHLPVAAVAAVLFLVAWGLVDVHEIGAILRHHRSERVVLLLTFVGTLVDLEKGLFLGILTSLVIYLHRTSQPALQERIPDPTRLGDPRRKFVEVGPESAVCPQLAIVRLQGSLYFGAAEHVQRGLQDIDANHPRRRWLLLVARGMNFVDLAGAQLLAQESLRRRSQGGGLALVALQPAARATLQSTGYFTEQNAALVYDTKGEALRAIYARLDPQICSACRVRLFEECQTSLPGGAARERPGAEPARCEVPATEGRP